MIGRRLLQVLGNALPGPQPLTKKALRNVGPDALLRRSRAMASTTTVGQAVLCRILTRYRLYVAIEDVGFGCHVMLDGIWENWLTAFMAHRIEPGMHVVDVGANHGYYTLLFAHLAGSTGRVAAVEPHPVTAALLRRSIYANGFQPWTTVFEGAATAGDNEMLNLSVPEHEPKNAHLVIEARPDSFAVRGDRLATMLADWPRVDFIKIDVEGAEETCVEGAWPLIKRDRPMMVLEFNALRCVDPAGLLDRLEALYGEIRVIGRDARAASIDRSALLDTSRLEDWMLYLES